MVMFFKVEFVLCALFGLMSSIGPDRYFALNGACIYQNITCATGYVLLHGICQLAMMDSSCPVNEINGINGQCSTQYCVKMCQKENSFCDCSNVHYQFFPNCSPILCKPKCYFPNSEFTTTPRSTPVCPKGTIPVKGSCLLIYCEQGFYRNGKCTDMVCESGTVLNGLTCELPEPLVKSITLNNSFFETTINGPNILFNSLVNITVPTQENSEEKPWRKKCCAVYTPRICHPIGNFHWQCYSKRYKRCGDLCIPKTVY